MSPLVLSIFPGGGLLDYAFEAEGFTVVRGPDPLWGGDIRRFHPPAGRFDGVIGGDPCQSHSSLANLVRAKGLEPSFPDLTGEYQRVVEEAKPSFFLRENVPQAPDLKPAGYDVRSFLLDNSMLDSGDGWGNEQMRRRRFWFGVREGAAPELRAHMDFALFELPDASHAVSGRNAGYLWGADGHTDQQRHRVNAVAGDAPSVPVALGGSGKPKRTKRETVSGGHDSGEGSDLTHWRRRKKVEAVNGSHDGGGTHHLTHVRGPKQQSVTGRHHSNELRTTKERGDGWVGKQPKRDLGEMLRLQGLPEDWLEHQPWTMQAKRKIVGNGVAVPMGRQLARAIRTAIYR